MSRTVTLVQGDGIGVEVTDAARRILEAAGADIVWEIMPAGLGAISNFGTSIPEATLASIERNKVALKGPTATPVGGGHASVNVFLRRHFDLYVNLRPVKSIEGVETPFRDVDLVIVRENTEGLYSGLEHIVVPGVVESLKIITRKCSLRIARFAFEFARREGRRKVTTVHKANIMKLSDGLFLDCSREVAKEYPDIEYEETIIDNTCMQLVKNPPRFDVLLMENLYGDIVSDLCAGLVGGLGVVPGANIGDGIAIFEAVHGTAPDIAGKGIANPTAVTFSACMLLDYINERKRAEAVREAIRAVYKEGSALTPDLGGKVGIKQFTDAVIDKLASKKV